MLYATNGKIAGGHLLVRTTAIVGLLQTEDSDELPNMENLRLPKGYPSWSMNTRLAFLEWGIKYSYLQCTTLKMVGNTFFIDSAMQALIIRQMMLQGKSGHGSIVLPDTRSIS